MSDTDMNPADAPKKETGLRRQKFRKFVHKATIILAIITPLVFFIAAMGMKFGLWDASFGFRFLTLKIGPLFLLTLAALTILSWLLAGFIKPRSGLVSCIAATIVIALIFKGFIGLKHKADSLPFIHDITTDTQNVPQFSAELLRKRAQVKGVNKTDYKGKTDKREGQLVSVLQSQAYPDIRPVIVAEPQDVVFGKAEAIAIDMGWSIESRDYDGGIIEATATSFWYGFKDDIIIRLRPSEGGGTLVDMRSISRIGDSDLGKNAARIRKFMKTLQAN